MDKTLDVLPDEGKTKTLIRKRIECDNCSDVAHYKHTFLLPHARSNPQSRGYGKDDISWCEDERQFACREHKKELETMDGYEYCSTFPATESFQHMFLEWKEKP